MTPQEAAALLTVAAAFDNRKPDADAATAWALALEGQRFQDCRDAIVAYYRKSRDWIMPSDVIEGVQGVRFARLEKFYRLQGSKHLMPPRELADDPSGEQRWTNLMIEWICAGEITHPDQLDNGRGGEVKPRDVESLGQIGRTVPRA